MSSAEVAGPPRRVLVTGGAIGIGEACVRAFAATGDSVVVADVLTTEGEALVSELAAEGLDVELVRMDLREPSTALEAVRATERGGFDVVVANAGIARRRPFAELDDQEWAEV